MLMIIQSLDEAEIFVESHKNFSWDGWNIVYIVQDDYAEYLHTGFFDKESGKWYNRSIYRYSDSGWNIPDSVAS